MPISPIDATNIFKAFKPVSSNNLTQQQPSIQKESSPDFTKNLIIATTAAIGAAAVGIVVVNRIRKRGQNQLNDIIVLGKDRVRNIIDKLSADDFDSNKIFRANLHIHSTVSDGKLTPLEILQQAKACADKLPKDEKFTFALTDHDSIAGVKEIIKAIEQNPKEYQNIRFIPGIEMSTTYRNPNTMYVAADLDYLIYGFDPNNSKFIAEIERRRNALITSTENLIEDINQIIGEKYLTLDEVRKNARIQVVHTCSNGYLHDLKIHLAKILHTKNISQDTINQLLIKHFGNANLHLNANISTTNAARLATEVNAFSSLAHPGKTCFEHSELLVGNATDATNDIISSLVQSGCDGIEYHYMSYKPENIGWWTRIKEAFEELNIHYSKTGGYDTHGRNITSKR